MTQSIGGSGATPPPHAQTQDTDQTRKLQNTPQTQESDVSGADQAAKRFGKTPDAGGTPILEAPTLNPADMMIQLTALMSKIAELTATTQEEGIKGDRKDLEQVHARRMEALKTYYDKLSKSLSAKTGFFGRLVRAFKALFSGNIKEAFTELGKAFTENPVTAIMTILAPFCPFCGILAACSALQDQEFMTTLAKAFGADDKAAEKFSNAIKWVGLAVTIAVTIAASIAAGVATGGVAGFAIGAALGAIGAGMALEGGIKGYLAGEAQSEAYKHGAEADRTKAQSEELMGIIDRNMGMLQDIFDNLQDIISSVMKMIQRQQEGSATSAGAV